RLQADLDRPRRVLDERVRAERNAAVENARLARERLSALERALAEREGLPPAARALAEQGERLALSLVDVVPGEERAVAAARSGGAHRRSLRRTRTQHSRWWSARVRPASAASSCSSDATRPS